MKQKTVLALLLLLLTVPLTGLAATSEAPTPLAWLAIEPADEATTCAALSSSGEPEVSQQVPNLLAVGEDKALTCGSCGTQCYGATPGTVCGAYPKIGACNMTTNLCSTDGRYRCYCKIS